MVCAVVRGTNTGRNCISRHLTIPFVLKDHYSTPFRKVEAMAKMELEFIFLGHSISFLGSLWNHITDIQFTVTQRNNGIHPHRASYICHMIEFARLLF